MYNCKTAQRYCTPPTRNKNSSPHKGQTTAHCNKTRTIYKASAYCSDKMTERNDKAGSNNNKTIRVITKLPNTEQSSKGKGKTHKSTNRQNQPTTGKLGKPQ